MDPREPADRRVVAAVMDPDLAAVTDLAAAMDRTAVMDPAAVMVSAGGEVGPTKDEPSGKTGGCRSRSDASSVVAHSGRAGQSSGCVDASSVDGGITTDW